MRIDITVSCRSRVLRSRLHHAGVQTLKRYRINAQRRLRQHRLSDYQFANQIDQLIDLLDRDAQGGGLDRGRRFFATFGRAAGDGATGAGRVAWAVDHRSASRGASKKP